MYVLQFICRCVEKFIVLSFRHLRFNFCITVGSFMYKFNSIFIMSIKSRYHVVYMGYLLGNVYWFNKYRLLFV